MLKIALNKETIRNLTDKELGKAAGGKHPLDKCNPNYTKCDDDVSWVPGLTSQC